MRFRLPTIVLASLLVLLCAPAVKAQDGFIGAFSQTVANAMPGRSPQLIAADFDDDQKPDGAVLVEDGFSDGKRAFRIELHLTAKSNNAIQFSSKEAGLQVSALDVNRDGAPDIVIEKSFTHERLRVYLNNGDGSFRTARAEDFLAQDPSAPSLRTNAPQPPPAFCLPSMRNPESATLRKISMLRPDLSGTSRLRDQALSAQSAPRAPTAARAPPSFVSL